MKVIKVSCFCFLLVSYMINCVFYYPILKLFPWFGRKLGAYTLMYYCRIGLWTLGLSKKVIDETGRFYDQDKNKNYLIVSNHMSYTDIVVLASIRPCCFVTSKEIQEHWFLGTITDMSGCLYVERRNRNGRTKEVEQVTEGLKRGLNVLFFPEATSTDGEKLLRFRGMLFQAALNSGIPVKSFCINYRKIDGEDISAANRDKVFWYGDMEFGNHFFKLINLKKIEIDIHILDEIQIAPNMERFELASLTQEKVQEFHRPIPVASSRAPADLL